MTYTLLFPVVLIFLLLLEQKHSFIYSFLLAKMAYFRFWIDWSRVGVFVWVCVFHEFPAWFSVTIEITLCYNGGQTSNFVVKIADVRYSLGFHHHHWCIHTRVSSPIQCFMNWLPDNVFVFLCTEKCDYLIEKMSGKFSFVC